MREREVVNPKKKKKKKKETTREQNHTCRLNCGFYIGKQNRNRNKVQNMLTTELRTEIRHITQKEQRHIAGPLKGRNKVEQEKPKYLWIYKMKSEI